MRLLIFILITIQLVITQTPPCTTEKSCDTNSVGSYSKDIDTSSLALDGNQLTKNSIKLDTGYRKAEYGRTLYNVIIRVQSQPGKYGLRTYSKTIDETYTQDDNNLSRSVKESVTSSDSELIYSTDNTNDSSSSERSKSKSENNKSYEKTKENYREVGLSRRAYDVFDSVYSLTNRVFRLVNPNFYNPNPSLSYNPSKYSRPNPKINYSPEPDQGYNPNPNPNSGLRSFPNPNPNPNPDPGLRSFPNPNPNPNPDLRSNSSPDQGYNPNLRSNPNTDQDYKPNLRSNPDPKPNTRPKYDPNPYYNRNTKPEVTPESELESKPEPNSDSVDLTTLDYFNYFVKLSIGSGNRQEFKVIFDTGSSDLWVPNYKTCTNSICLNRSRFDPSQSNTFSDTDLTFSIPYIGAKISGNVGRDQFWISGLNQIQSDSVVVNSVKSEFKFGLANSLPNEFVNQTFDGILGLGLKSRLGNLPLDYLMNHLDISKTQGKFRGFSLYMSPLTDLNDQDRVSGSVTFSGINPDHFKGPISWLPLLNPPTSWRLSLTSTIQLGDQSLPILGKSAQLDSGSPYIGMPYDDARAINRFLRARPDPQSQGANSLLPCPSNNSPLPLIHLTFPSLPTTKFTLRPIDYTLPDPHQPGACLSIFIPLTPPNRTLPNPTWILGAPFLRSYSAIFDQGNGRIGLAINH